MEFSEFPEPNTVGFAEIELEAGFPQFPQSGDGFAEVMEADEIRHGKSTRAREQGGDKEPRRAPMPWLSQRSRGERIMDMEF